MSPPPTAVKMAARLKPGDVLVFKHDLKYLGDPVPRTYTFEVNKVERARGRKPAKGETLILHVGKRYPIRINSTTPVRVRAGVKTHMSETP